MLIYSNYERVGNKIGLHSRELGGGSTIDYITVETLTPVSPAAPVVQLGALYESQSGEAIVIDATPAAGFPAEFTYQWCFNGFKIPANLGGTASSHSTLIASQPMKELGASPSLMKQEV